MPALLDRLKFIARQQGRETAIGGLLAASYTIGGLGLGSKARGLGAIFMLHHVRPTDQRAFRPNAGLEITPETLDATLAMLKAEGRDFIALDDVPDRIAGKGPDRPFAAFTLDDGYRNNRDVALPVFAKHGAPLTIFICEGFARRSHSMWWETAGELLNRVDSLTIDLGQGPEMLDFSSFMGKMLAFERIVDTTRQGDETQAIARLDAAARAHGLEPMDLVADLTMDDGELRELARHPLVTLGAHTVSHRGLARLDDTDLDQELGGSAAHLESLTGKRPTLFAYPYGDARSVSDRVAEKVKALGMTAITTRPGVVKAGTADLQRLPRVSLNGQFQKSWQISALASGLPFQLIGK